MRVPTHIGEVPLHVIERHSDAIIPWSVARRSLSEPPFLLTLDRHTDTMEPFLRWAHRQAHTHAERQKVRAERTAALDWRSESNMEEAAHDLWHDEHIQAAMKAGILRESFVVAFNSLSSSEQAKGVRYLPSTCRYGCTKKPHDDDCEREQADLAIDDTHLSPLFGDCPQLTAALASSAPMFLDIDLDYFRTLKSLSPASAETFSSLVPRAVVVTVATEPEYTKNGALDPGVSAKWALQKLLNLLS